MIKWNSQLKLKSQAPSNKSVQKQQNVNLFIQWEVEHIDVSTVTSKMNSVVHNALY